MFKTLFKGKLTYGSLGVLLLSALGAKYGVSAEDATSVVDALIRISSDVGIVVGFVGGLVGRYRATLKG